MVFVKGRVHSILDYLLAIIFCFEEVVLMISFWTNGGMNDEMFFIEHFSKKLCIQSIFLRLKNGLLGNFHLVSGSLLAITFRPMIVHHKWLLFIFYHSFSLMVFWIMLSVSADLQLLRLRRNLSHAPLHFYLGENNFR